MIRTDELEQRDKEADMRNKKAFAIPFLALSIMGAALAQAKYASAAVTADEKAMAAEKRPDFNSPQVEDKALKVPGLPEALTWYTSKPSNWGSARAKQGGTTPIASSSSCPRDSSR
jgi:hypothetical protein